MKNVLILILPAFFILAGYPVKIQASEKKPASIDYAFELVRTQDTLQQKSNINTSRSNIKHSKKPADIGVNEPGVNKKNVEIGVSEPGVNKKDVEIGVSEPGVNKKNVEIGINEPGINRKDVKKDTTTPEENNVPKK